MNTQQLFLPLLALQLLAGPHATQAQISNPDLHFVQNKGQITDQHGKPRNDLDFRLKVNSGFSVFIGKGLIQYQWCKSKDQIKGVLPETYQLQRMDVQLLGANKRAIAISEEKVQYYEHYHLSAVGTTANAYQKITYKSIYPHIDWVVYLRNDIAEYDFVLHPGAKASDIKIQYTGPLSLQQNADGSITAKTSSGQVTEHAPAALQEDGKKVASRFVLNGQILSFRTAPYTGTLTIDPVLEWATYLGGSLNEFAYQCATDRSGNVYVAGSTASTSNIASTGAYQTTYGGGTGSITYVGDAYMAKFSPSGARLWTTYYGGTGTDQGWSVATDSASNVYLAGFTNSTAGISTVGAQQVTLAGGNDAFLVKFDSMGVRQWGTYFGGTGNENMLASASCDLQGHVYLTGVTVSANGIATTNAHQGVIGGSTDAFLAQYNSNGSLQWATYYGGSGAESNYIQSTSDAQGNVYLCGLTTSSGGIATPGAYQAAYGGTSDGFLAKFSSVGVRGWGTYYGGTDYDRVHAIVCGDSGALYLMGATWATYYNGNTTTAAGRQSLAISSTGNLYFTGYTSSTTGIATIGAFKDTLTGGTDALLAKFSPAGVRLWATYYGGGLDENARATTTDGMGHVYICGETSSGTNVSTTGGNQPVYGGGYQDGFLVQFSDCDVIAQPATINGSLTVCKGGTYTYSIPALPGAQAYSWSLPNGWIGTSVTNSITVVAGIDSGTIRVHGLNTCMSGPEQTVFVGPIISAELSPVGKNAMCAGDQLMLHTTPGAYQYQWLLNGILIQGAVDSTYQAGIGGRYEVVVAAGGCSDTLGADTLIIHPLPVPVIALNSGVLTTSSYTAYQWLYNGSALTGAVNADFHPLVDGNYTVTVVDGNGCSGTSEAYTYTSLSMSSLAAGGYRIYPIPAHDLLYATGPFAVRMELMGVDGRLLRKAGYGSALPVKGLATGVYVLRILEVNGIVGVLQVLID